MVQLATLPPEHYAYHPKEGTYFVTWIAVHIDGGTRKPKRCEKVLLTLYLRCTSIKLTFKSAERAAMDFRRAEMYHIVQRAFPSSSRNRARSE